MKPTLPKMNLGDIIRYSSAWDVFKPTTGADSVDPAKLDPANCGRGGKKVSFVLLREFTNKESLWWFWVKNWERHLSWIPSTQKHTLTLSLSAMWLGRQLQGAVLPWKEGRSTAIPGSGKDWRQIAPWECVYSSVSHVCSVQYLPVLDIYYSQTGVYSVDQRRTGTWLLLLSGEMSTPLRPPELFQWICSSFCLNLHMPWSLNPILGPQCSVNII